MLDENGFVVPRGTRAINRRSAITRAPKPVNFVTFEQALALPPGDEWVYDCEVYRNFFYVAFKHLDTGSVYAFEQSPDYHLDIDGLARMMWHCCGVGFNIRHFDNPIIAFALRGGTNDDIKNASDAIIRGQLKAFQFSETFKIEIPNWNCIDLIEVAPLEAPLKLYNARLHGVRLQDLPFDPDDILSRDDAVITRAYCCNDLDATENLFRELLPQLTLRVTMSNQYGVDLRSKSDAQVAEAAINSEIAKLTHKYPRKPKDLDPNKPFKYDAPAWVRFDARDLNDMLYDVSRAEFYLDGLGKPTMPIELEDRVVTVAGVGYKMGMGGLHSMESEVSYVATPGTIIADNDVESFYPAIILNQGLYPSHLGEVFLTVYRGIVERRLEAKKAGNKVESDSLKITINGTFGKLGNKYSTLFAPKLLLQTTITGQLALLMLIEAYARHGITVISANTDGVVTMYRQDQRQAALDAIAEWRGITAYKTEETFYAGVYSRDVNNYLAVKMKDGKPSEIKTKGVFSEVGSALNSVLSKNPETLICADAIKAYLLNGTPIEQTITRCTDIRRFVAVARAKTGAQKNGEYLGKIIRWYYAKGEHGYIGRVGTGNKVPMTDGARPCMDLPDAMPADLDFAWYVNETRRMMYSCAILHTPRSLTLF